MAMVMVKMMRRRRRARPRAPRRARGRPLAAAAAVVPGPAGDRVGVHPPASWPAGRVARDVSSARDDRASTPSIGDRRPLRADGADALPA